MKKKMMMLLMGISTAGLTATAAQAMDQTPFQVSGRARNVTFVANEDCGSPSKGSVQRTEFAAKVNADEAAQKLCGENLKAKRVSGYQVSTRCRYSGTWYSISTLDKEVVANYICGSH